MISLTEREVPGSRPASARALAEWAAQIGDAEAPSRPTISRWLSGATLPTSFRPLELMVLGVREHSRNPPRQARETLLRAAWWQDAYERALRESGRGSTDAGHGPPIIYQGLEPFGRADAERFFGRARDIEAMRGRLGSLRQSPTGGVLLVLGQSGIGKSSLLAAGLLPALERHGLGTDTTVTDWPAAVLTPGPNPLLTLAEALDASGGATADPEDAALRLPPGRQMILVVDQFEEIFQVDQAVRHRFVTALVDAATPRAAAADTAAAVVVIACRNEFYPELRRIPSLKPALDAPFNLDPLTGEALTEAVKEPARRAGITVGPGLVDRLLADAGVSGGGMIEGKLPLISHVLRLMNQSGPMTVRAYERVGGIDGAVTHTADQAWDELQRAGLEDTALALLVQLVRVGDHPGHDTRRHLDRAELPDPGDGRTGRALEILADARLITIGEDTVQITHEALIRAWQRLRDTIDSERADHVQRQNIALRARQWDEAGRSPDQLLRGTVLADAHRVTAGGATHIDDVSREFLAAGDRQEHLASIRRRRQWASAIVAAVLIVAAGTVAVIAWVGERQASQRAILSEVIAHAKQLTPTDSSLAAQLWLTAYRMQPSPELYTALLSTENTALARPLHGHTDNVRAVGQIDSTIISAAEDGTIRLWSASPDGPPPATLTAPGPVTSMVIDPARHLMITGAGGEGPGQSTFRIWNVRDVRHPVPLTPQLPVEAGQRIGGLATSPDGRLLTIVVTDGTTRLWNIADPARPVDLGLRLPGTTTDVYGSNAAISPDNRTLAVAGDDGSTRLWDIADPTSPAELAPLPSGTGIAHAVAFSPSRRILVTGGGNSVLRLWDLADPGRARMIGQTRSGLDSSPSILSVAISPDEQTVAVGAADNTATLWNISDPSRPTPIGRPLTGHTRGVGTLAFGPDGHSLITGSADDSVRAWSLPATRLSGVAGNVTSLALSHGGDTLAVGGGGDDNAVHLWDTTDTAAPVRTAAPLPLPGNGSVDSLAIATDDSVLAAASGHTVRMWNIRDPHRPRQVGADLSLSGVGAGVAISPDRQTLAVGTDEGLTRLFSLADPARPTALPEPLPSTPGELVSAVDFSPDGRVLATAGNDHAVRLWDVADPTRPRPIGGPLPGHTDDIYQVAFSPDGTRLASVGANHTTHIWDLSDPSRPREEQPLLKQTESVGGVSWSPDGTTLATGSSDMTVALWDMTNPVGGRSVGDPITGHTDNIYATSFGAGGVLASGGRDRTVRLWHLDVDRAIGRVCAATPDTLTGTSGNKRSRVRGGGWPPPAAAGSGACVMIGQCTVPT
ncbi:MAG: WD40 repeat domain-containing protein [Pseudonocardia sp.]|nr:WD40 repeat domain-containing protein [Pseudonocardia sp.]